MPAGLLVALVGSHSLGLGPPAISAVVVVSASPRCRPSCSGGRLSDRWRGRRLAARLALATAMFAATFAAGRRPLLGGQRALERARQRRVPVIGAWSGELFPTDTPSE